MSNTIDERVVVLKFDNRDFESNAQKSLDTLDKLDKNLKFDNVSKSLSGISVSSKSLGLTGVGEAVDSLAKRFSNLGIVGMTALQEITKFALRTGASVVKGVFDPIINGGKQRALNMEKARFQLEGVLHDSKKAEEVLGVAKDSVNDTAYAFDQAAMVSGQFVAAGIQDNERLATVLKAVAGTAATFGAEYSGVAQVFAKIASSGKASGQEWLQLSQRGVPVTETLVQYMNDVNSESEKFPENIRNIVAELTKGAQVTADDVLEMRKKGVINFELFSAAMSDAFGEHAKDSNKTFTGVLTNTQAALKRIGEKFYAPLIQNEGPMVKLLAAVKDKINEVGAALGPFAELFGKVIGGAAEKIANFLNSFKTDKIATFLGSASKKVGALFGITDEAAKKNQKAQEETKKTAERVAGAIKTVTKAESDAAWAIWLEGKYGNQPERAKNLEKVGLSYKNVQSYVNALIKANFDLDKVEIQVAEDGENAQNKVAGATDKTTDAAKEQLKKITPLAKFWAGLKNIGSGLKNIFAGIGKVFGSIGKAFKNAFSADGAASGFLSVTEKFKEFTGSVHISEDTLENVRKTFEGLFKGIGFVIKGIGKLIGLIGKGLYNAFSFLGPKIAQFGGWVHDAVEKAGGLEGIFGRVKDTFTKFFETIKNSKGFQKFVEQIKALGSSIGDKLAPGLKSAKDEVGGFIGKIKLPSVEKVAGAFSKIFEVIGKLIERLRGGKDAIVKFFKGFTTKGSFKLTDLIPGFGGSDSGGIFEKVKGLKDKVVESIKKVFSGDSSGATSPIKDFFSGMFKGLKEIDWKSIAQIAKTILQLWGAIRLIKATSDFAQGFKKNFKSIGAGIASIGAALKVKYKTEAVKQFAIGVAILVGALWAVAMIPREKLLPAVATLGGMMTALVGAIAILSKIGGNAKQMAGLGAAFIGMGAGLLMLSGAVAILGTLDPNTLIQGGLAVVGLMMSLALASKLASGAGGAGLLAMSAALLIIIPALKIFSMMPWSTILDGALKMGAVMVALAFASKIASGAKGGALTILAIALAMDLIVPALAILSFLNPEGVIRGAACIAGLMIALGGAARLAGDSKTTALTLLAMAVPLTIAALGLMVLSTIDGPSLITAAACLAGVVIAVAAAANIAQAGVAGALAISAVLGVMTICLYILGSMGIEQSIALAVSLSILALSLATACALFAVINPAGALSAVGALAIFFFGLLGLCFVIGKIAEAAGDKLTNTLNAAIELAHKMGEVIGAFIGGIGEGISNSLPAIAENLKTFSDTAQPFFNMFSGQSYDFSALGDLAGALIAFTANNFADKISSLFNGGKGTLEKLGNDLVNFATPFLTFALSMAKIPDDAVEKGGRAMGLVQYVYAAAKELEGSNTKKIAKELDKLGTPLLTFAIMMSKVPDDSVTKGAMASSLVTTVFNSAKECAKIKIKDLGKQLEDVGEVFVNFTNSFSGIDASSMSSVSNAISSTATTISQIGKLVKDIPAAIVFCTGMSMFTSQMQKISQQAAKVSAAGFTQLTVSVKSLIDMTKQVAGAKTSGLASFTSSMSGFLSGFSGLTSQASSTKSADLSGMKGTVSGLASIIKSANAVNPGDFNKFVDSFNKAGSKGVEGFIKAMTGAVGRVRSAASGVASAATNAMNSASGSAYRSGYNVGKNIVQGLIDGINSKIREADRLLVELGKKTHKVEQGAQVNSPSKITLRVGASIVEGLVLGIKRNMGRAEAMAEALGENGANAVGDALLRISDIVDSNVEDNLTITPVLDLSNVQSGAKTLSSLLDNQQVYNVGGRLRAAGVAMAGGYGTISATNDDVVNAIDGLGKQLDKVSGDSYTIGGITYDDGSNVSSAIRQLIQAARMERRR